MDFPFAVPVSPMLARSAADIPVGGFLYEPKWDGFRCVVMRDGEEVELGSRNEKPLTRYFPEIVAEVRRQLPRRCVLDGELVVATHSGLDFDALSQRIHPAASRVRKLAESCPASFVAFDVLHLEEHDLTGETFASRRLQLEGVMAGVGPPLYITPITREPSVARDWFSRFEGAGLDGVVAKASELPYRQGQRVMWKVKHERTADFVVGGFRWYRDSSKAVGSLMLGLYDESGLNHVGVIGSFPASQREAMVDILAPLRNPSEHPWSERAGVAGKGPDGSGGAGELRRPGPKSRWSAGRDLSFEPLEPILVVEAAYEHLQGRRLRHTARFRRWRADRDPLSCTYDQLEVAPAALLSDVFAAGGDVR